MMVTFVSQCEKKALNRTRRVLIAANPRIPCPGLRDSRKIIRGGAV